jgi:hypothetical protein
MTSLDQQQRNLEKIQDGREAVALAGILRPYIDNRIALIVHETVSRYRQGMADYPFLLGNAAKITALMDTLSDLENKTRLGDIATAKEMGNAKT